MNRIKFKMWTENFIASERGFMRTDNEQKKNT
jgi:hypothetical protein